MVRNTPECYILSHLSVALKGSCIWILAYNVEVLGHGAEPFRDHDVGPVRDQECGREYSSVLNCLTDKHPQALLMFPGNVKTEAVLDTTKLIYWESWNWKQ